MPYFPGMLAPVPRWQIFDADGNPVSGAKVWWYVAGTSTDQAVYADAQLTTPLSQPVQADAGGLLPAMYLLPTGYKVVVTDSANVLLWDQDEVIDVGAAFIASFGRAGTGSVVTSGHSIIDGDGPVVRVNSTGGPNPCVINMPPSADWATPLVIKNLGTIPLAVTPRIGEVIDTIVGAFSVPAAASPAFPSIELLSDGVSGWFVIASHKVP